MPRKPPKSPEQRLARWSQSMAAGTMNGRVASATPMALDRTQLAPRLRAQPVIPAATFDPNETPVIIGFQAVSGSGTPDNPSVGATGAVVVGDGAEADGANSVSVGPSSRAINDFCIGVGYEAQAVGTLSISIGASSLVGGPHSVGLGPSTSVSHTDAVAIGYQSATTKDNQIMLGTVSTFVEIPGNSGTAPNGLVLTDTATGTRYIVRITSGALVLSAAP